MPVGLGIRAQILRNTVIMAAAEARLAGKLLELLSAPKVLRTHAFNRNPKSCRDLLVRSLVDDTQPQEEPVIGRVIDQ